MTFVPGLNAATEYELKVQAYNGSGASGYDFARASTLGSTNTGPTVSITAPAAGATVSGTITVTASASASNGVASVQFQVDGVNKGVADTASPFTLSLDTRSLSNASHTISAIAKDKLGATSTSAASFGNNSSGKGS